jgi:hypothetical protein
VALSKREKFDKRLKVHERSDEEVLGQYHALYFS